MCVVQHTRSLVFHQVDIASSFFARHPVDPVCLPSVSKRVPCLPSRSVRHMSSTFTAFFQHSPSFPYRLPWVRAPVRETYILINTSVLEGRRGGGKGKKEKEKKRKHKTHLFEIYRHVKFHFCLDGDLFDR